MTRREAASEIEAFMIKIGYEQTLMDWRRDQFRLITIH